MPRPHGPTEKQRRRRLVRHVVLSVSAFTTMMLALAENAAAETTTTTRFAELDGSQIGTAGDADGSGAFIAHLGPTGTKLCWALTVRSIDRPTAVRIHKAAAGAVGPVVLGFKVLPAAGNLGAASGCVPVADAVLDAMRSNASQFYVAVATKSAPNGTIRGQLRAVTL